MSLREMLWGSGKDQISFHFPHHKLGECKGHPCSQRITLHNQKRGLLLQIMSTNESKKKNPTYRRPPCCSNYSRHTKHPFRIHQSFFFFFFKIGIHKSLVNDLNPGVMLDYDRSSSTQFVGHSSAHKKFIIWIAIRIENVVGCTPHLMWFGPHSAVKCVVDTECKTFLIPWRP